MLLSTINSHRKHIQCCAWNKNGNWFATGGKDSMLKIYDIRVMKEMESFRGHNCDVCSLAWHPQHESLLASGGYNGSIIYWLVGQNQVIHSQIVHLSSPLFEINNIHYCTVDGSYGNCFSTSNVCRCCDLASFRSLFGIYLS